MLFSLEVLSKQDLKVDELLDSLINIQNHGHYSLDIGQELLQNLDKQLQDMKNELDVKSIKIQRELESAIKVSEINMENKQNEKDRIDGELLKLKNHYAILQNQIDSSKQDNPTERLNQLEIERFQIEMTQDIVDDFIAFEEQEIANQPQLYYKRIPLQKACQQLYVLNKISLNLKSNKYTNARKNIARVYQDMQHYLFSEFKDVYWRLNITRIKELLPILEQFEMMKTITQFYIESLFQDFKINMIQATSPQILQEMTKIFDQIKSAFQKSIAKSQANGEKNYFAISEIFQEYSSQLLQQFISFTFNQIVLKEINLKIDQTNTCVTIILPYKSIIIFDELWVNEIKDIEHNIQVINLKEISDNYFQSIFEEYQHSYIENEFRWLSEQVDGNVAKILNQIGKRQQKEEKLSREEIISRLEQTKEILLEESIENIFKSISQSLQRNEKVSAGEMKIKLKLRLIEKFLISFGDNLLRNLVEFIAQTVPALNRKTPVDENFFLVIPQLNTLVSRVDIICNTFMKEWDEQQGLIDLIQKKEGLIRSLEILINKAIQLALASIFINCKRILQTKQNKKDFLSKEIGLQKEQTEACRDLNNFLWAYMQQIKKFSSSSIKRGILQSIGEQLIIILVEHFSQFQVSISGSFQLSIDISTYRKLFFELENEQLLKEFEVLEILTNLFKVSKDQMKKYIEDEALFRTLSQEVISNYIARRVI